MDRQTRKQLCSEAAQTLQQTPQHRRLVLIWAGIAAGAGLLTSLISMLLGSGIAGTGGLEGMGTRSMLTTLQTALLFFTGVALPFWEIGYHAAALEMSRSHQARVETLPEGFRRFGPVFRFLLLQMIVYLVLAFTAMQVGSFLYTMSPAAGPMIERMFALMEQMQVDPSLMEDPAVKQELMQMSIPAVWISGALMLLIMTPVFYRLRLAPFLLMDDPGCRARQALFGSVILMRKNCFSLFLLDLRYWWFYLGELAVTAICYGDLLLPMIGIPLPGNPSAISFLFYALGMAAQVGLYVYAKNQILLTYAGFYQKLRPSK